jgi:hypothetical protein
VAKQKASLKEKEDKINQRYIDKRPKLEKKIEILKTNPATGHSKKIEKLDKKIEKEYYKWIFALQDLKKLK